MNKVRRIDVIWKISWKNKLFGDCVLTVYPWKTLSGFWLVEEYLPMGQNIEVEFSGVRLIWNKVTAQNLTLVWAETVQ